MCSRSVVATQDRVDWAWELGLTSDAMYRRSNAKCGESISAWLEACRAAGAVAADTEQTTRFFRRSWAEMVEWAGQVRWWESE